MLQLNSKAGSLWNLIMITFLLAFTFINRICAEEEAESIQATNQGPSTRIVISTSGPVKYTSHWLDNPYRLVVEFKTRNVFGNLDKEVIVNQGVIKKITSTYFSGIKTNAVKTLIFELTDKVPYRIWQEGNSILVDIQVPLETTGLSVSATETFLVESSSMIKKLEAMDNALRETQDLSGTLEAVATEPSYKTLKDAAQNQIEQRKSISTASIKVRKNIMGLLFSLLRLALFLSLGFLFWLRYKGNKSKDDMAQRIRELKSQLQEKDKFLEQDEILRKAIEKTAIENERAYEQLKLELQEKESLFQLEGAKRKEKEKVLQELEREYEQLKKSRESLKDALVKRGVAKELTSPGQQGELWVLGKSEERRNSPRLALTKDFHNTVILKIELPGALKSIKSFAENISARGLCFETKGELDEKNPINLRLFFYGGKVPNFKTQGWIVWKKTQDAKNYYGITLEGLSEKVKLELEHYIESNIVKV